MSRLSLTNALDALKRDLTAAEGPRISTIRNYRFAILVYAPEDEFELRKLLRQMSDQLRADAWNVLEISVHKLLMRRLRELGPKVLESWSATEKRQFEKNPSKALERVKAQVARLVEGEDGIAADIIKLIGDFADKHPDQSEQTVIWIKRLGALYPFSRSSNLLKVLDGKTRQLPVILLYPGSQPDKTALSFMAELTPDRDYRPRIYS